MEISSVLDHVRRLLEPPVAEPSFIDAPDDVGHRVAVVRDGYKVELLPGPQRARRGHIFHDLDSFAEWLNRHATAASAEILVADEAVDAVLEGETHLSDQVQCALRPHPTFQAFRQVFSEPLAHRALLLLIRGNRDAVVHSDVILTDLASLKHAVGDEISAQVDPTTGATMFAGRVRNHDVQGKIPSSLVVKTPVWDGVHRADGTPVVYDLDFLVTMETEPSIHFMIECPALHLVLRQARLDVKAHLDAQLDDGFLLGLGDLSVTSVHRQPQKA